ncbi:MAG: hypothetical protein AAB801_03595 [Patescibacteria group bacterium]
MSDQREALSLNLNQPIEEVQPIRREAGIVFATRAEIAEYVELPLLPVIQSLYDRNIRTLSSSANMNDIRFRKAGILVDFDSLSPENQQVAREIGEVIEPDGLFWKRRVVFVKVPVVKGSTVGSIQSKAEKIFSKFLKQPMHWAATKREDLIKQWYRGEQITEAEGMSNEELAGNTGAYYDSELGTFFLSEEHARKYREVN